VASELSGEAAADKAIASMKDTEKNIVAVDYGGQYEARLD
jgi:hypothetical protein